MLCNVQLGHVQIIMLTLIPPPVIKLAEIYPKGGGDEDNEAHALG